MGELSPIAMASPVVAARGLRSAVLRRGFHSSRPAPWKTYGFSPVKTNGPVEKYAAFREDIESEFRADNKTSLRLGIFAVVMPLAIYAATTSEFDTTDRSYGHDAGENSRGN